MRVRASLPVACRQVRFEAAFADLERRALSRVLLPALEQAEYERSKPGTQPLARRTIMTRTDALDGQEFARRALRAIPGGVNSGQRRVEGLEGLIVTETRG